MTQKMIFLEEEIEPIRVRQDLKRPVRIIEL